MHISVHISVLNGALWDMGQVHCGVCVPGLFSTYKVYMHHSDHECAHFCSEWCTVGYGPGALWDLCYRSIQHIEGLQHLAR